MCFLVIQYDELMKKRQIVLGDKAKIEQVIRELDEKKNEALKKAHVQVNRVSAWKCLLIHQLSKSYNIPEMPIL